MLRMSYIEQELIELQKMLIKVSDEYESIKKQMLSLYRKKFRTIFVIHPGPYDKSKTYKDQVIYRYTTKFLYEIEAKLYMKDKPEYVEYTNGSIAPLSIVEIPSDEI